MKNVLREYVRQSKPYAGYALLCIILYAAGVLLQALYIPRLANTMLQGVITDDFEILKFVGYFCLVVLGYAACYICADFAIAHYEAETIKAIRKRVFLHLLSLPVTFFKRKSSGAMLVKYNKFYRAFEEVFDFFVFVVLITGIKIIGVLAVATFHSLIFGATFFFWVLLYIIYGVIVNKKKFKLEEEESDAASGHSAYLVDWIANMAHIINSGNRATIWREHEESNSKQAVLLKRVWYMVAKIKIGQRILEIILFALSLWSLIYLKNLGEISNREIMTFYLYLTMVTGDMWNLARSFAKITRYFADAGEMIPILNEISEVSYDEIITGESNVKDVAVPEEAFSISFNDVYFKYPYGKDFVLKGINMVIPSESKVALIGKTGCGKSTLIHFLTGEHRPTTGEVLLNGVPIEQYNIEEIRKNISIVSQTPPLFNRSIRYNLCYDNTNYSDEELFDVLKRVELDKRVYDLKNGLDTEIGERGIRISGGEGQRLAIARAILERKKLIVFDEGTSALDEGTESSVKDMIYSIKGITIIFIAHRLITVADCDSIFAIKDGIVKREGISGVTIEDKKFMSYLYS